MSAPFLLRRLKPDKSIISNLPGKIGQEQYCTLAPAQTALYESVVQQGLAGIEGAGEGFKRQGLVLQMILALKQVCNRPAQYLKQGPQDAALSGKAARLLELLGAVQAAGCKALVFTQFRQIGELLAGWLAQRLGHRPPFLHGGVGRAQRWSSAFSATAPGACSCSRPERVHCPDGSRANAHSPMGCKARCAAHSR